MSGGRACEILCSYLSTESNLTMEPIPEIPEKPETGDALDDAPPPVSHDDASVAPADPPPVPTRDAAVEDPIADILLNMVFGL